MNADAMLDSVREATATELSRLGSSKALYAATEGDLDAENVFRAAATAERAAAETFEAWADVETNEPAAAAFRETAVEEREHAERVREELDGDADDAEESDDDDANEESPAMAEHLRDLDDTVARAGGFLGRVLVADESKSQYVGYFVGDADPSSAAVFRELRGDLEGQRERALDLLDAVCETEEDWERAEAAAVAAIEAAYEAHVEALKSLGVDPKPVC